MNKIERQILDNQGKIMMFLCNGNKDDMIGNLMVTRNLLAEEELKEEGIEMPERAISEDKVRDIYNKGKKEFDAISKQEVKTISVDDECTCGHNREWHNKDGCHANEDFEEQCECKVFEFAKNKQDEVKKDE